MPSMHRPQQSLTTLTSSQMNSADVAPPGQNSSPSDANTIGSRNPAFRHSLDMKQHSIDMNAYFAKENGTDATSNAAVLSPKSSHGLSTPPKLQSSFSANDIPTVKGSSVMGGPNANAHAQQHLHNHNASIGRIPPGAMKRHSRELSSESNIHIGITQSATFPSIGSALHANAPAFGPTATSQAPNQTTPTASSVSSPGSSMGAGNYSSYYGGNYGPTSPNNGGSAYNVPLLAMQMGNMNMNGYSPQNYTGYAPMYQAAAGQPRDSQQRVIQQRRAQDNEAMNRFNNTPLEAVGGTIFELCKDQHGCRYLQKQLENRIPEQVHMIWLETNMHVVELMTDPFGNYLCQKLLEYCNDDERTVLIRNASESMVHIALNQHGTRALQKMIEFVSIPEHVQLIVNALRYRVVDLIQDLNGNHVIQKCLNKLSPQEAQFIFDAVGNHCVEVGTHRHGCCVLQRCIDHASGDQKIWLIGKITENALRLVQDPFGNYVVQYIIDLNESTFTEPLVVMFTGKVAQLSRHKFSSNVIEKCLRCASDGGRDMMVNELLNGGEMDRLLRDSFGNYVVQTALEHSTYHMKHQLVEAIRPILPGIRSTPYGRRLQAKIQTHDTRSGQNSGQSTPADSTQGQLSLRQSHNRGGSNAASILSPSGFANRIGGGRGAASYPSSSTLTVPPPQPPRFNQTFTYPGANVQPGNGEGQFF
ncbi:armadillo-type protein [Pseudomassariella vexata]|uniref:Armadillo-type protein n=1 Tax=Pseudomassariella vexata TaxID=1141098 RepID=A0A1Y2DYT1_9PEZI|nr:armadillo-type protein [Pseudomassariella vexata]ORY64431.1 armadillo-type protein [Pseudomassariella vexata]